MLQQIRDKVNSMDCVCENEYFEQYCQLISDNLSTSKEKFFTNAHHIIPQCYFISKNLEIDNSSNNLVNLRFVDHVKAHILLSKMSSSTLFKKQNVYASCVLLKGYSQKYNSFLKLSDSQLEELQSQYVYIRNQMSTLVQGDKNPHYGVHTNYGGSMKGKHHTEESKHLMSIHNPNFGKEGNRKGSHLTLEQRQQVSDSLKLFWSTEEGKAIIQVALQKSWEARRQNSSTNTTNGMHCYVDQFGNERKAFECPEDCVAGRSEKVKSKISQSLLLYYNDSQNKDKIKQARAKRLSTIKSKTPEEKEKIKAKQSKASIENWENKSEEEKLQFSSRSSSFMKEYHKNLTEEQRAERNQKNSLGQLGKKIYENIISKKHKMFYPEEVPEGWVLVKVDRVGTTGKRKFKNVTTDETKMFKPGEEPEGWVRVRCSE